MSRYTLSRLPEHVVHMFKVYERASNNILPYNIAVKNYFQKSSNEYHNFQRYKLLAEDTGTKKYNMNDFSPLISKCIAPMFEGLLKLDEIEDLNTNDLFQDVHGKKEDKEVEKEATDLAPILSSSSRRLKNYTDFQAQVALSFASYFSPYTSVPNVELVRKSFQWYQRLLNHTPVIFVLKQTNRLFSDTSLAQINKPLSDFSQSVSSLQNKFTNQPNGNDKNIRNYHFTDLTSVDVFNLAIKSQCHFELGANYDTLLPNINWEEQGQIEDALSEVLLNNRSIEITDESFNPVHVKSEDLVTKFPLHKIFKELEYSPLRKLFPYDVKYDEYHLLTIENPIINDDHSEILDLLDIYKEDFEIISVRLGLNNEAINSFFSHNITSNKSDTSSKSYEDLLRIAKSKDAESGLDLAQPSNIDTLMKRLGEFGLVSVEEGCAKNCIYLLPRHL